MKNVINFCSIIAVCTLLGFSTTTAQAQQNIAHVDAEGVIAMMPEYLQAKSNIETLGTQLQKNLEADQKAIEKYYNEVMGQVQGGTLPPVKQKEAEAKLAEMQQNLQKEANKADKKLADKELELTKPVYDKFNAALDKVAKANGYSYIIDIKLALYSGGGTDATPKVKAELGL